MKSLLKQENKINYVLIIIVTFVLCIPLFQKDFDIYKDDGVQHVCRLIGTYQTITEGQPFAVIMSNFCNGFGYSWNLFYSPFTAMVPLIFHFFTNSFVLCLKLFLAVMLFLSGVFMYQFVKKITTNSKIGLIAAFIYLTFPYHLTDLYTRNAVSEFASFAFLPMVFLGLYQIIHKQKEKSCYLVIGAVLLFLTHSISTLIAAIFSALYVLTHYKQLKEKNIVFKLMLIGVIILLSTSFFWAPMLEHRQATSYEVFREGMMGSLQMLQDNTIKPKQLFYTDKGDICFEIGIISILLIVTAPIFFRKVKRKYKKEWIVFLLFGIICLLVTFTFFPWSKMPNIFGMIQFPWRFLEFAAFFFSITGAIQIGTLLKSIKYTDILIISLVLIGLGMVAMKDQISYQTEITDESKYWYAQKVEGKNQRIHAGLAKYEYLPTKANQNRDYIANREAGVIVLEGQAKITQQQKQGTHMTFLVEESTQDTKIELPYIFYLGYNVTTKGEKPIVQESQNGFVQVILPELKDTIIEVQYTGTNLMKITTILSWLTILSYALFVFLDYKKEIR